MMLLLQMDITQRVEMEARMAMLTETQLSMLDQVWSTVLLSSLFRFFSMFLENDVLEK
jgi:hypothetical protein